ncbi:Puromycin N-acetyltransferase [Gracilariopsis chorda]|uniref:Puromycin N-acetyltransferase n=1 Tax=Gracilariopsis chorda TaxID=448386 RepID=A0A2V3IQU4_9FLOR|nr:Puromycin N-acetyltransferase [Gracilariopsis chorda]|eukprot:PXF44454.1 Puromycin N-acetyltransferase [Gracilariopsis chorda]
MPNLKTVQASTTAPTQRVRVYTKSDPCSIHKLASSLASAFQDDPFITYMSGPNTESNYQKNLAMMRTTLRLELSRSAGQATIHVSQDNSTIAVWHHVGHWKMPLYMELVFVFTMFRVFGWAAFRFMKIMNVAEKVHQLEPPHMHLFIIGTERSMQGKGGGSSVISEMLRKCDSDGIPVYLESSNEKNLSFYKKHGFDVLRVIPGLPEDCPPMFSVWRPPKPVRDT